ASKRTNAISISRRYPPGGAALFDAASGLSSATRKSPARRPARAVSSTRVDDAPPLGDLQLLEAQGVCERIVRPWDRREGSAVRDEDRGRIDHLLHLQQQCLGLRTNLRFATIDRPPVPTDGAQADRGRFHRKCGAGLAERLKRSALAASCVRRS